MHYIIEYKILENPKNLLVSRKYLCECSGQTLKNFRYPGVAHSAVYHRVFVLSCDKSTSEVEKREFSSSDVKMVRRVEESRKRVGKYLRTPSGFMKLASWRANRTYVDHAHLPTSS